MLFHLRRSCRLLAHSLHIASPRNIGRYGGIAENRLSQTTRQARQAMLGFSWWVYTQWGVRALGRLRRMTCCGVGWLVGQPHNRGAITFSAYA